MMKDGTIKMILLALTVTVLAWTCMQMKSTTTTSTTTGASKNVVILRNTNKNVHSNSNNNNHQPYSLTIGELPGYTGWARPGHTLAGYYQLTSMTLQETTTTTFVANNHKPSWFSSSSSSSSTMSQTTMVHQLSITVACTVMPGCEAIQHESFSSPPWFYARAYGPTVISGILQSVSRDDTAATKEKDHDNKRNNNKTLQDFEFDFYVSVPGLYTIEIVMTFSHPPPISQFPLSPPPHNSGAAGADGDYSSCCQYEGYLISGFPLQVPIGMQQESSTPQSLHDLQQPPNVGNNSTSEQQQQQLYSTTISKSTDKFDSKRGKEEQLPYCTVDQLTEQHWQSAITDHAAAWHVVDSIRQRTTKTTTTTTSKDSATTAANSGSSAIISLEGYQSGYNSLGIRMGYQYADCSFWKMPPLPGGDTTTALASSSSWTDTSSDNDNDNNPFACLYQLGRRVHFILIGDSTMRLQVSVLKKYTAEMTRKNVVQISFLELYGGAIRCDRTKAGPHIVHELHSILHQQDVDDATSSSKTLFLVLFNTGLHDIHRLCGDEFAKDRTTYLTAEELRLSCTELYQTVAVRNLLYSITDTLPADRSTIAFQTTTAAWPKYGNFGIAWDPRYGQPLPLDASFIQVFNQLALTEIQSYHAQSKNRHLPVRVVDGFWITYGRPDHREVDNVAHIGKKLSHPGIEVVLAMVRSWSMLFLQQLQCPFVPS